CTRASARHRTHERSLSAPLTSSSFRRTARSRPSANSCSRCRKHCFAADPFELPRIDAGAEIGGAIHIAKSTGLKSAAARGEQWCFSKKQKCNEPDPNSTDPAGTGDCLHSVYINVVFSSN